MKYFKKISLAISLVIFSCSAFATGMPVIDVGVILQTVKLLEEAKRQFNELKDLTNLNKKQFDLFKNNITGAFGYGDIFNDKNFLKQRQWSNDSWTDVLNETNGNSSAFKTAQIKYDELYKVRSADEIFSTRGTNNLSRAHYEQSRQISRSALAASSYSYDQINEHIKSLHEMVKKLDEKTSQKASIDLSARLIAEIGFIQLEMLRQQTIQNQLLATQTQSTVNGISDQSQFLQWQP